MFVILGLALIQVRRLVFEQLEALIVSLERLYLSVACSACEHAALRESRDRASDRTERLHVKERQSRVYEGTEYRASEQAKASERASERMRNTETELKTPAAASIAC